MEFCTEFHGANKMSPADFGDPFFHHEVDICGFKLNVSTAT